ncbi:nucleotidyltransferase domain-containing protein [Bradyrhizobium sp. 160]|uniref:nucleotidyltransferase domain-containing protein n=1 Tax=Bradyrhizobium sp. 160 TaxID=2782634 RepID=UPI001FF74664|nr:nucleotidyltransferase domain-containing protein [Bradyrhizobium sp. 160]
MTEAIERAKHYSEKQLEKLRSNIKDLVPSDEMVFVNGSYARREASEGSDIDFYVVTTGPKPEETPDWVHKVKSEIERLVPIEPAEDGAFAKIEPRETLLHNIGGENDSNQNITRRMLLLLEGEWLFNDAGLKSVRRSILERYIADTITDHQLALFLLNDIVRYYRTMAVDYEFKTIEGPKKKPWGIRNIKLIFSRKLLYAGGLFSVAATADLRRDKKIEELEKLFNMTVIDRLLDICGKHDCRQVLRSYDRFLNQLEKPEIREHLKGLTKEQRDDPVFRDLKNEGHHFTRELLKLFERTFDSTHPIRRAIIF